MKRGAFIAVALAMHLSVFWALRSAAMTAPKPARKPIEVSLVEKPKPPPPAPPPETPKPKLVKHVDNTPPPPKPSSEPPPPPVFGLSLNSTSADSAFTMQAGNTTMTEQQKGPPSKDVRPLSGVGKTGARGPVSLTQLTKMPEKIGDCPPGNPSQLYTAEGRDRGIEGDVVIETELDAEGRVTNTRALRKLGYGLDESAANAIRTRCKFKPAEVNGEKVGTKVTLTFHFIIEE